MDMSIYVKLHTREDLGWIPPEVIEFTWAHVNGLVYVGGLIDDHNEGSAVVTLTGLQQIGCPY